MNRHFRGPMIQIKAHGPQRADARRDRGSPVMIFLVEDDDAARDAIRLLLEIENLPVRDFATCDILRKAANPHAAGCLILDVQMPGTSGLALLEQLAADGNAPPVILMSGHLTRDMLARAKAAGAFAVLDKPFNSDEFLAIVTAALAARAARA